MDEGTGPGSKPRRRGGRPGEEGGARPPEPRRRPAGPRPPDPERMKAEALVQSSGIPYVYAVQVVRGERTLNDVVRRLAVTAETEGLIKKHGLSRALATQIARGDANLEEVLRKARLAQHMEANRDRSVLTTARDSGRPLAIAVHGGTTLRGRVLTVDPYEFEFAPLDGQVVRIHKLRAKYAYDPEQYKLVRKVLRSDPARKGERDPIAHPQERYGCSDRRLFRYLDTGALVTATTLEGDVLTGRVTWMGRWEFGLKLDRSDAVVVMWRHALADLGEAK